MWTMIAEWQNGRMAEWNTRNSKYDDVTQTSIWKLQTSTTENHVELCCENINFVTKLS